MTEHARPATLNDLKRLVAALHAERADYLLIGGYALLAPEWFEEGEGIRLADEVVVDLVFKTCGETYDSLKEFEEVIDRSRHGARSHRQNTQRGTDT